MRDCDNGEVRDLLPELLDGDVSERLALARAHVAQCEECRAELELLRRVRAATAAPTIHLARIGSAIPTYRPSRPRRILSAPAFRIAAAILLVVGIGSVVLTDAPDRAAPDTAMSTAGQPVAAGELPLGTPLGELSDADLRDLLSELGELQAVTPTDADVVVLPALDRSGA